MPVPTPIPMPMPKQLPLPGLRKNASVVMEKRDTAKKCAGKKGKCTENAGKTGQVWGEMGGKQGASGKIPKNGANGLEWGVGGSRDAVG